MILVLGGSGYIGSALCGMIDCEVYDIKQGQDVRNVRTILPALQSADKIVHLAGTSMDPLLERDPEFTWQTNYLANELISKFLRNTGKRIVYASSGSVYGAQEGVCTEDSLIKPLTLYAKTKALSEELFLHKDLNSVVFRFATAYGRAPFTRHDTIINGMTKNAKERGEVVIDGGHKRRSLIHVKDIAKGIIWALNVESPRLRLYNLGSNEQNLTIQEIGEKVAEVTGAKVSYADKSTDNRSYHINYDQIAYEGFKVDYSIEDGIKEIYETI